MSTIKVNNLQNASAASPAIVLAADGSATAQVSSLNGGPLAGTRNHIINGDMRIDQRNAGAALNNAANGSWAVDRWVRYQNVGASNIGRNLNSITPPAGFTNYLGIQISTAGTASASEYTNFQHYIEGFNAADLAWGTANAQSATISFWVRSSLTGGQGFALQNGNNTLGYPFTVNISAANTWEYKSITIPGPTTGTWDTTNGRGITLIVDLGMGSNFRFTSGSWQSANVQGATGALNLNQTLNATFYITGVQLEPGTVATPFERRSYGQELALCQRYYYKTYNQAVVPGSASSAATYRARAYAGSYAAAVVQFPVLMRTAPTCTVYNSSTGATNSWWDIDSGASRAAGLSTALDSAVTTESFPVATNTSNFFHIVATAEL